MKQVPLGFDAQFAPELKPLVRPLESVQPHPENIRKHKLEYIQRSLARFGQQTPLTVQKSTMYICKGNGTWAAAKALGWSEIAYHVEDFDDATALQYLFADNKASDLAEYDAAMLRQGLHKLVDGPGLTDSLWTIDELEDLEYNIEGAQLTEPQEFKGDYADAGVIDERKAEAAIATGAKMREVSLVISMADHADFIRRLRVLQVAYGTTGSIATILEAVKRAAEAVEGRPEPSSVNEAAAAVLDEVRGEFSDRPQDYFTGKQVADRLTLARLTLAEPPTTEVADPGLFDGGEGEA